MQSPEIEEVDGFTFTRRRYLSARNENRQEINYYNNLNYTSQQKKGKAVQRHDSVILSQEKSSQQTLSPVSPYGNKTSIITPPLHAFEVYTLSPETTSVHQPISDHSFLNISSDIENASNNNINNNYNNYNKYLHNERSRSIDRNGMASLLPTKVFSKKLYTQIDQNLEEPLRLQQLLIWCIQRKTNEYRSKDIEFNKFEQEIIKDQTIVRNQVCKIQNHIIEQLLEGNIDTSWDNRKDVSKLQCMIPSKKNARNQNKIENHLQLIDILEHENAKWQSEIDKVYEEHAVAKDTSLIPTNKVDCDEFLNNLDLENKSLVDMYHFSTIDPNNNRMDDEYYEEFMKLISTPLPRLLMSRSMDITELRLKLSKALYKQQNQYDSVEKSLRSLLSKIKQDQQMSIRKYLIHPCDNINEKRKKIRKLFHDHTEEDRKSNLEFLKLLSSLPE